MTDFLGELLDRIDNAGSSFSENAYAAMSADVLPLFRLMFILFVLFYGIQLIMGTAKISASDIVLRIVRALFILILISSWPTFNQIIYSWISSVPEAAGRAILATSGTGITEPTDGLSQIWGTANEAAAKFSEQSGFFSVLPALVGFFIMVVCGFFIATALAILILAKVMLWVLIGTAPVFIALFLFDHTKSYAMGWLNQVFVYALVPLFVYTLAAFIITAANTEITAIQGQIASSSLKLGDFAPFILICFAGAFVMLQIQSLTMGIAGAASASLGTFGALMTGGAIAATRAGAGSVGKLGGKAVDRAQWRSGRIGTDTGRHKMREAQLNQMERNFDAQKNR